MRTQEVPLRAKLSLKPALPHQKIEFQPLHGVAFKKVAIKPHLTNAINMTIPRLLLILLMGSMTSLMAAQEILNSDWMRKLPDATPLTKITLPGTHNTVALHEPIPGVAACQSLKLAQQLDSGVRYLDLRCRHLNNKLHLYHGIIDQHLTFADALVTIEAHLKKHPSETIILSITEERRAKKNTRPFLTTLKTHLNAKNCWLKDTLPSLGQARGKMILLRRFRTDEKFGIPATNWKSNTGHSTKLLHIQDHFHPANIDQKWRAIEKTFKIKPSKKLLLNFTSGYLDTSFAISITKLSTPINKKLTTYLSTAKKRPHGIIITDFITPEISQAIISLNFPQ